jgi:hypothetical protein
VQGVVHSTACNGSCKSQSHKAKKPEVRCFSISHPQRDTCTCASQSNSLAASTLLWLLICPSPCVCTYLPQALSLILLTSPEVRDVRETLRGAAVAPDGSSSRPPGSIQDQGSALSETDHPPPLSARGPAMFAALYPSWAHAPGALLGLCLLAQVGRWAVTPCKQWCVLWHYDCLQLLILELYNALLRRLMTMHMTSSSAIAGSL